MEAGTGIEPVIEVLQTSALPLGYPAKLVRGCRPVPGLYPEPAEGTWLGGRNGRKCIRKPAGEQGLVQLPLIKKHRLRAVSFDIP